MRVDQLKRRELIKLLGGAAAAWPLPAHAEQPMRLIGFLSSRSPGESADVVAAFRKGLRQIGFVEGRNIAIAFRWAEGYYERLPALAADLVDLGVAVLFAAGGTPSALVAKAATSTIPIVFVASDPIKSGLVASLNRPGGNVTGISNLVTEVVSKSIEILAQTVPTAAVIACLVNPSNPIVETVLKEAQAAASTLGLQLHVLNAGTVGDLDEAFATLARLRIGALRVMGEPFFDTQRERLVGLSARYAIAGCYPWREYVLAGGLMSYGSNLPDSYRQAGIYVGRVLQGERPTNLPVMQPTKFELVLNLTTAKALRLTIPPMLLALADEVIE